MSNPSTAIGEHGQLSGRFPDACQLEVGIAITKAALIRGERLAEVLAANFIGAKVDTALRENELRVARSRIPGIGAFAGRAHGPGLVGSWHES